MFRIATRPMWTAAGSNVRPVPRAVFAIGVRIVQAACAMSFWREIGNVGLIWAAAARFRQAAAGLVVQVQIKAGALELPASEALRAPVVANPGTREPPARSRTARAATASWRSNESNAGTSTSARYVHPATQTAARHLAQE
jgi:hypothetical protein